MRQTQTQLQSRMYGILAAHHEPTKPVHWQEVINMDLKTKRRKRMAKQSTRNGGYLLKQRSK